MKTISQISFWLFSITTIVIFVLMFPVILCPMMWLIFTVGIGIQFFTKINIIPRVVTVFIFLLIAFRIYYGFVTDFTISMPDTIGLKFVLLAGFYTIGSLLLYVKNYSVKATSVLFAVAMIYTGFLLIKEIHFEAFERFQKENPDCIALDNFESAKIKHLIDESYERMDNGQDLGMISGSKIVDGRLHKFTIADGSAKNIPPLFSVSALNDDSVSMKVLFRYDPVFRYGYLKYEVEGEVSLHKDSAFQLVQSLLEDLQ